MRDMVFLEMLLGSSIRRHPPPTDTQVGIILLPLGCEPFVANEELFAVVLRTIFCEREIVCIDPIQFGAHKIKEDSLKVFNIR